MSPVDKDPLGIWLTRRSAWLRFLERLALKAERLINLLVGTPRLNPFYYTGPLASFLLLVVILTGLYLTLFFQFGFEAAYQSVTKIEGQVIARLVRAIHRYASDAAVLVSLAHAFRILFMGRFRGPRWLAWVSGVAMMAVLWLTGVSGYWLIWDQRAQLITISFTNLLRRYTPAGASFAAGLVTAARTDRSWIFILILLLAHILLSALLGLFFWFHILRLNRPKFLPERHWLIGLGAALLAVSVVAPVGLLPLADLAHLPGPVTFDPLFLFFLPLESSLSAGWLWSGLAAVILVAGAVPWLSFRRQQPPRVAIDPARCTGCTHCWVDCPYQAITMAPRPAEDSSKPIALEHPDLCVSCGLCVGSCDTHAISLGELSAESLWCTIQTRLAAAQSRASAGRFKVVFTCERHAVQGASPYLNGKAAGRLEDGREMVIIPLTCVASIHPNLLGRTLEAGAAEVLVVGCPPADCAQREGNLWLEERVSRKRLPRLKRAYETAPISTLWLPPDAFPQALHTAAVPPPAATGNQSWLGDAWQGLSWRNFVPAIVLLGLALIAPVWLNHVSFRPYPALADRAIVQVVLPDPAEPFGFPAAPSPADLAGWPTRLRLEVDNQVLFEKLYDPTELLSDRAGSLFEERQVAAGEHYLRLSFEGGKRGHFILAVSRVTLSPGQIFILGLDDSGPPPLRGR
ncbi:MAG: cytochrome b N-terminal domain-containing protein [Chloroflexota bacterium]